MKKALSLLLILMLALSLPLWAEESFTVSSYDVDIEVGADGTNKVTERLDLDFHRRSHGIFRDIQDTFELDGEAFPPKAKIKNITVNDEWETERNGSFLSIRIGDEDVYVEGPKTYDISYDYIFRWDPSGEFDQFYYNIVSPAWDTTMDSVTWSVSFPAPVSPDMIWVTRGYYGDDSLEEDWTLSSDGMTLTGRSLDLMPYEAVTLRAEMPEGYFSFPEVKSRVFPLTVTFIVLAVLFILWSAFSWWKWGNDDELIVPVRFSAPEGMSPLDCGFIIDGSADLQSDVLPMIFYWADRGYMTIRQVEDEKYEFTKIREMGDEVKPHEKKVFDAFFSQGDTVTIEDVVKGKFGETCQDLTGTVRRWYQNNGPLKDRKAGFHQNLIKGLGLLEIILFSVFLSIDHLGMATMLLLIPSFIVFSINSIFSYAYFRNWHIRSQAKNAVFVTLSMIPTCLACLILIPFLSIFGLSWPVIIITAIVHNLALVAASFVADAAEKRSEYGNELLTGVLGYREFLDKVEVEKLEALIEEDPEYFYHNLAYAACFGLTDKYISKFKGLAYVQPEWLIGDTMDYLWWRSMSRSWRQSYLHEVSEAAASSGGSFTSSGSSGFSGGGFSGGGGRSW